MYHNGISCKQSRVWGWRQANGITDLDDDGNVLTNSYIVIVRIKDCPVVTDKIGREFYDPKGVPQALRLGYGGTAYGYGKSQIHKNTSGRYVRVITNGIMTSEFRRDYVKTPMYVVRDGRVYVGAIYREIKEKDLA